MRHIYLQNTSKSAKHMCLYKSIEEFDEAIVLIMSGHG